MVKSMGFDLRGVIHFCRSNVVGLRLLFLACRLHVFMTDHHDCSRSCVHVCTYTSSILLVSVSTFTFPTYYYDYDLPCEQPWLALSARFNQFMQTQFAGGQRLEKERRCGVVYCVLCDVLEHEHD